MTYGTMLPLFFLGNIRGWEWIVIFLLVLLLFGGKKIPELMRGLGKGINSFKRGMQEARDEINRPLDDSTSENSERSENSDNSKKPEDKGKDRS